MSARNNNGAKPRWGSVLRRRKRDEHLTAYRRLSLQLHYDLAAAGDDRSVLFVSPTQSSVSAHGSMLLACCAAEELRRPILLVDLCERDPETSRLLGVEGRTGFGELRCGTDEPWRELALPTSHDNVFFLPAGAASHRTQQSHSPIETFLSEAKETYGLIVLTGGSVLDDSAASAIAPLAGCVLLAVIENETRLADLDAAQETLTMCGAKKLGLLMTTRVRGEVLAFQGDQHRDGTESQ